MKLGEKHPLCPLVDIELDYRDQDAGAFQSGYDSALDDMNEQLNE